MDWLSWLQRLGTLVVVILPVFVVVVFGGCDINSLQNCVHQLVGYERQVSGGLIAYTEPELEELCRRFDDISVCVKRATSTCPLESGLAASSSSSSSSSTSSSSSSSTSVSAAAAVAPSLDGHFMSTSAYKKKFWSGLESSFTFLCKYGKHIYLKHLQCFSTQPLQSSIRFCNRTYHMNRASAHTIERTCSVANDFLHCLRSVVRRHCGDEAGRWEMTVVQRLRQPSVDSFGCRLGSRSLRANALLTAAAAALVAAAATLRPRRSWSAGND